VLAGEGLLVLEQLDKTWKELEFAVHIAIGDRTPPQATEPGNDKHQQLNR